MQKALKIQGWGLLAALLLFSVRAGAADPGKGFKALAIYDYFKARSVFIKCNAKKPNAYACYGLALISSRSDNPFASIDSACKYVNLSYSLYSKKPKPLLVSGFTVDSLAILALADTVAQKQLIRAKKKNTVNGFNRFLSTNYLAGRQLLKQAVYLRDELEYSHVMQLNRSDSTTAFILTHPQSSFYAEALVLKDRELYDELTLSGSAASYTAFIARFPKNIMVNRAYERLFSIYRQRADVAGLAFFVKNYPQAPQTIEAWKLLFSLSVKAYSFSELKKFLESYPAFPLKNSILKELELNKLVLYPYQKGDLTGFINEEGRFAIEPVYDAATDFYEGLSVVTRNDSVFFINKENVNPFGRIYTDAMVFRNGLAPVKAEGKWFFINRQGQTISKSYDEIGELSGSIYVVKEGDRYGALDQYGQNLIEPRFDKLGDFKNGMAYYTGNGSYGFVSAAGTVHKAEFEWISDFDEEQIAIIKQNNKYGLIAATGRKILEPQYDLLIRTGTRIFIAVSNNSYGFFSTDGCFVTGIYYDFSKEKNPDFYTNGKYFRLLKKKGQSIVDVNGHSLLNTETYSEINFMSDGLMRVKKKKKFGYTDRKLNVVIPFKYSEATDFSDSLAMVTLKEKYLLIDVQGREVYSSAQPIEKISQRYYLVDTEPKTLINNRGETVMTEVQSAGRINSRLVIISLSNGEIKLIND